MKSCKEKKAKSSNMSMLKKKKEKENITKHKIIYNIEQYGSSLLEVSFSGLGLTRPL